MTKLTAAQERFLTNATLIAASRLVFQRLARCGVPLKRLSEIAETTSGGTPDRNVSSYYGGDIPWIKSGELNDGLIEKSDEFITEEGLHDSAAKVFPKGTLLIALYGATVGKTGILGIEAASNQAVCAVIPKDSTLVAYLHWYFRYKRPEFLTSSFGGAQPNISQGILRDTILPVPSLHVQQVACDFLAAVEFRQRGDVKVDLPLLPEPLSNVPTTIARIEELSAKIEEARSLKQKATEEAEALKASWLNSAFLDLEPKSFHRLDDVAEIIGGGSLPDTTLAESGRTEVIFVKVSDMNRPGNEIYMCDSALGVPANSPLLKGFRILPSKSIVFPKRGGAIATNKKRMLQRPAVLDPNMMGVFAKDEQELAPEFLFKWFGNLDLASMQDGTSVPQINKGDLAPILIPVPPLAEQSRIISYLDGLQKQVDSLKRLQTETAQELNALMPSILSKAFAGEL
jgi:type I restriction enzyme S subunit